MKTRDAMQITVQTHPNGYGLTVNGNEFMYFNEVDLLAGFMAHVGLGETQNMERGTILSSLMSAMLGDAYANCVSLLKQRVGLLTSQINGSIERMDRAVNFVNDTEAVVKGFQRRLDNIGFQLKATEADYEINKKEVDRFRKALVSLDVKAQTLTKSFEDSGALLELAKKSQQRRAKRSPQRARMATTIRKLNRP